MNRSPQVPKIAFVIHRFGEGLGGGIERSCRLVAEKMSRFWDIQILTTCARNYVTWKNEYPEGTEHLGGFTVLRFPVDRERDPEFFSKLTESILERSLGQDQSSLEDGQIEWMKAQGPYSSRLFRFIEDHRCDFDLFVYFSYLYASTYFGIQNTRDRAALVPAAHKEPMLDLAIFDSVFKAANYNLFGTLEEQRLLRSRFGRELPGEICGIGISNPPLPLKDGSSHPRPYLIYVGRIDAAKGCDALISYFLSPPPHMPEEVDLLLVGHSTMDIPAHPRIHALGYVEEQEKNRLISGALALVMPSLFESLSIVLLEAWMLGTPVIANGKCDVLKGQCFRSGGGAVYSDVISFSQAVYALYRSPALRAKVGLRGLHYVQQTARWDRVEESYLQALRCVREGSPGQSGKLVGTVETGISEKKP